MLRALFLFLAVFEVSPACTCVPRTPKQTFCISQWVAVFKIGDNTSFDINLTYDATPITIYKRSFGIPQVSVLTKLHTFNQSSLCGVRNLVKGELYLLSGHYDNTLKMRMSTCPWLWAAFLKR
ncbi:hypothetical protein L596_027758 [Steinernema carpocapsae]|uniref:NTR domain-containing protein n=1 Tax=Steinernema carpocapsae TaxID=34508 RepID=A0A4U5LWH9_STECR|nr:hypothetical protein L596_027758 [Steinernema carpocapsae]